MSKLLTSAQLGELLEVGEKTVRRWHVAGRFPAVICEGRLLRFDPVEVLAALRKRAAQKRKAKPARSPGMVPTF